MIVIRAGRASADHPPSTSHRLGGLTGVKWPHMGSERPYTGVRCKRARVAKGPIRVVKLPVIYFGGKLLVSYRPLPDRMGHRVLALEVVGQSLGLSLYCSNLNITQ